jgi:hypothetical protein
MVDFNIFKIKKEFFFFFKKKKKKIRKKYFKMQARNMN